MKCFRCNKWYVRTVDIEQFPKVLVQHISPRGNDVQLRITLHEKPFKALAVIYLDERTYCSVIRDGKRWWVLDPRQPKPSRISAQMVRELDNVELIFYT